MPDPRPLVVGFDGSNTARRAVERSSELAASLGAPLHVVSVVTEATAELDGRAVPAMDAAEAMLVELAETHDGSCELLTVAAPGVKAAEGLCDHASRVRAQLLVVGNRNMQGVKRLLGSVANDVTHNAPCDVLVVRTS